jgi:hypothetical protein
MSEYRSEGAIWLRETQDVSYFGGTTAWEDCDEGAPGAVPFWKLVSKG